MKKKSLKKIFGKIRQKYYYISNETITNKIKAWKFLSGIENTSRPKYQKKINWIYRDGILYVMTYLPGHLIGAKGRLINDFENSLRNENKHFKFIRIVELGVNYI